MGGLCTVNTPVSPETVALFASKAKRIGSVFCEGEGLLYRLYYRTRERDSYRDTYQYNVVCGT